MVGYVAPDEEETMRAILTRVGFDQVVVGDDKDDSLSFRYRHVKASGMLRLVESDGAPSVNAPRYVPVQSGEERILVDNGWSFLDADETEPMSAFDVDAEVRYVPSWGEGEEDDVGENERFSAIGYPLSRMTKAAVLTAAERLPESSRSVLLHGATDPPHVKRTRNGIEFSGSFSKYNDRSGVFVCAVGGAPLFTANDLKVETGSSGWLSFRGPVSRDHIEIVPPKDDSSDQREEVIDARSGCHLGHYFGEQEGYCINAGALDFFFEDDANSLVAFPGSWRALSWTQDDALTPSQRTLRRLLRNRISSPTDSVTNTVVLGCGCFWHVETALRRLPGVVSTETGYAGGTTENPTYEDVCRGDTGHAEVVRVVFDPIVTPLRRLVEAFLCAHDPSVVRAHGKRASGTGQYRSLVIVHDDDDNHNDHEEVAQDAVEACRAQLGCDVSTEVVLETKEASTFYRAEERHQRRDERIKRRNDDDDNNTDFDTLSFGLWLSKYGKRVPSTWGSSETVLVDDEDSDSFVVDDDDDRDDGMAQMMI